MEYTWQCLVIPASVGWLVLIAIVATILAAGYAIVEYVARPAYNRWFDTVKQVQIESWISKWIGGWGIGIYLGCTMWVALGFPAAKYILLSLLAYVLIMIGSIVNKLVRSD